MRQLIWSSLLALSVAGLNCVAMADDAMDTQLAQARSNYQSEFAAAHKALVSALEKHQAAADGKGDSQQAAVFERDLAALEKSDLLPGSLPNETHEFLTTIANSKKRLLAALQRGEKHYQDRNDQPKKLAVEQEIRGLESAAPRPIGLLNAIQPTRDGTGGGWSLGAEGLVFDGGASAGRLRIPFASKLSEEYELEMAVLERAARAD